MVRPPHACLDLDSRRGRCRGGGEVAQAKRGGRYSCRPNNSDRSAAAARRAEPCGRSAMTTARPTGTATSFRPGAPPFAPPQPASCRHAGADSGARTGTSVAALTMTSSPSQTALTHSSRRDVPAALAPVKATSTRTPRSKAGASRRSRLDSLALTSTARQRRRHPARSSRSGAPVGHRSPGGRFSQLALASWRSVRWRRRWRVRSPTPSSAATSASSSSRMRVRQTTVALVGVMAPPSTEASRRA